MIVAELVACAAPTISSFDSESNAKSGRPPSGQFGSATDPTDPSSAKACIVNKANYDVPGDGCDNDGDGTVDNPPSCDATLTATGGAEDFARALGICDAAADKGYGLVSATFTRGYGRDDAPKAEQHGILPRFGNVLRPREGSSLGVLSTGYAQEYNGAPGKAFADGKDWWSAILRGGNGSAPPGFPRAANGCEQANEVNDVIDLKLTLKAPPNATGLKFDFNFMSSEWPAWVCSEFNDGFVAFLAAKGFNDGKPDNISFDPKQNPVSVNNGFFDRCTPGVELGCATSSSPGVSTCPGGPEELAATGFGLLEEPCGGPGKTATRGGATGWLSSQAPVLPGETFTLELMVWDTGDGNLDSSVLLDNFEWLGGGNVATTTERPPGPR